MQWRKGPTPPLMSHAMIEDPYTRLIQRLFPEGTLSSKERLTGGVSADVERLDIKLPDGELAHIVLRAHGATHSGLPAALEHKLLGTLHQRGVPVAKPLIYDEGGSLLPDPFLVLEFVEGTTIIPEGAEGAYIDKIADALASIHALPPDNLPALPVRSDPLPDVFDYLPKGNEWHALRTHLRGLTETAYAGPPTLLHGDFWPENLLWQDGTLAAILDWEDAALGDPLSDVACTRLELRYKFGKDGMQRFTQAYARHRPIPMERLALWQVYVAAAAQRYMSEWGLPPARETHMRVEALSTLREAGAVLMGEAEIEL